MKRKNFTRGKKLVMLLSGILFVSSGCDDKITGELVALTGAYLGDVVAASTTGYLLDVIGIEPEGNTHEHEGEHPHAAEPLHEHEH